MSLTFRCHAYGNGESWEAICVDLDIATFGASLDEVKASLATCVEMYLEAVAESPPEEQRRLLARRAPWHVRAKLAALTWLFSLRGDTRRSLQFTVRPHAAAHP